MTPTWPPMAPKWPQNDPHIKALAMSYQIVFYPIFRLEFYPFFWIEFNPFFGLNSIWTVFHPFFGIIWKIFQNYPKKRIKFYPFLGFLKTRGCSSKFATGLKYVTKSEHLFNKWLICSSKIDMLGILGIKKMQKKNWRWYLEHCRFFSNMWLLVVFFCLKRIKKGRNDNQKLHIRIKSSNFKISSPNFLCKFFMQKNSSILILEWKISHLVA